MIAAVRSGGSPFETALIGAASVVPAATIGVYGGAIADALPKRMALGLGYLAQALVCLAVPLLVGTRALAMALLILLVNVAGQVSGPTESAIVPTVVPEARLGLAASRLSFAGAVGSAIGTAALAPFLVTWAGVRPLFLAAALSLGLSVAQVVRLPAGSASAQSRVPQREVGYRASLMWLLDHPSVATMMLVAAIAGTSTKILQTLSPGYVHTVFGLNPAESVYVFAPAGAGLVVAQIAIPWLLRVMRERVVAVIGVGVSSIALVMLGMVTRSTPVLGPLNLLLQLRRLDPRLSPGLLTASALAIPMGFGVNATGMAVTVYIQKRVRQSYQGRAFALNSLLKNLITVGPLILAGVLASAIGERWVLFALPTILIVATSLLVRASYLLSGRAQPPGKEIAAGFLRESAERAGDNVANSPE